MPELQNKKNGKNEASKRDRLLSQGFPLLVCALIIGFVLFNELRPSSVPHKESIPTKEPAPAKELQGESEDVGGGNGEDSGDSKENRSGGNNTIEQIKKGVEIMAGS